MEDTCERVIIALSGSFMLSPISVDLIQCAD